jgi:hypothetical protein
LCRCFASSNYSAVPLQNRRFPGELRANIGRRFNAA